MIRPSEDDYPAYCRNYVSLVTEADILDVLEGQLDPVRSLAAQVTQAQEHFAYAPGKWTIREVAGHLGDCERVFGFRALAFSRADVTPLPGFDENAYVAHAGFDAVVLGALLEELTLLRQANLRLLRNLDEAQWTRSGIANGHRITVRALAFMMAGHLRHHLGILRTRYGIAI